MKTLILIVFLSNFAFLFAQKEIPGFAIDNAGTAISGIYITEKGTNLTYQGFHFSLLGTLYSLSLTYNF